MKRYPDYLMAAILFAALALGSCGNPGIPGNAASQGGVMIQVQPYSTAIQQLISSSMSKAGAAGSRSLESRMFVGAGLVKFKVTNSVGTIIDSWDAVPMQYNVGMAYFQDNRYLPAGEYTLWADVFSSAADYDPSDPRPSVKGFKSFTIQQGQSAYNNWVNVTCYPANPQTLDEAVDSPIYFLPHAWEYGVNGIQTVGSDLWMTVTPTTSSTTFKVVPETDSTAQLGVVLFDQNGTYVSGIMAQNAGETVDLPSIPTTSNGTYFLAVFDIDSVEPEGTFRVRYDPAPVPPTPIVYFGQYIEGFVDVNQAVWYSFPVMDGYTYKINWDDYFIGSGQYSVDVYVEAFLAPAPDQYGVFSGLVPCSLGTNDSGYKGDYHYRYGTYYASAVDYTHQVAINPGTQATTPYMLLKVRPFNSGMSGTFALKVAAEGANLPPSAPMLNYPSGSNIAPNNTGFGWNPSGDPNGDPIQYTIYLGLGTSPASWTTYGPTTMTNYIIPTLSGNTTYSWYVVAEDLDQFGVPKGEPTLSGQWTFTTTNSTTSVNVSLQ